MKILVLVQSVNGGRYPELIKTQQETWDSIPNAKVDVYYYYPSTTTPPGISGNVITVGGSEHWTYMFINTIRAFREVMHLEWDYIFKTDNSAYVCKEELVNILKDKPRTQFYGGHMHKDLATELLTNFLWGEGYALSRDLVAHLIDVYANNPTRKLGMDDCWIGNILTDKVKWDTSLELCEYYNRVGLLPYKHLYRCKNDTPSAVAFDDEMKAMHEVHKHLMI